MLVDELRAKYPEFVFEKFEVKAEKEGLKFTFSFNIASKIRFRPEVLILGVPKEKLVSLGQEINNLAFHIGLMEIPSYWKATCSPKIVIKAGKLDEFQLNWWHDLLIRGMGQFFYENKIDFIKKDFVQIQSVSGKKFDGLPKARGNKTLIPVGGGKDSAVTLELLKHEDIACFVLNPFGASLDLIKASGVRKIIRVERKIDPKLLQLNEQGFLNGHTPFSAYLAFLAVSCAVLFDYRHIAFSNERSANEENITYLGHKINHQYSKTFEFEQKFRKYNLRYLTKNVNYFSFLRPLYEIQISKIFAGLEKYHMKFRSCNAGQKTNTWCCRCPKCLSTFILLYPFLGSRKTKRIFGKNLYQDKALSPLLRAMVAEDKVKPFECLGTREEIRVGLFLSAQEQYISKEKNMRSRARKILEAWDKNNNLIPKFQAILKKAL